MPVACFDSSAFVKLLVAEPDSDQAARLWDDADAVTANRLAYPEVRAALAAGRRAGRLDRVSERRAQVDWNLFWSAVRPIDVTEAIARAAADLAGDLVLGGADAVHLASALTLAEVGPLLVTWDRRLWAAASEIGLLVAPRNIVT